MIDHLFATLTKAALERNSLLCIGLDPHPELLDSPSATAASIRSQPLWTSVNDPSGSSYGPSDIRALSEDLRS